MTYDWRRDAEQSYADVMAEKRARLLSDRELLAQDREEARWGWGLKIMTGVVGAAVALLVVAEMVL